MKRLAKIFKYLALCLLVVLAAEFLAFYRVLTVPGRVQTADVVAVFAGSEPRLRRGYELAGQDLAKFLIVSPAAPKTLEALRRRYKATRRIEYLVESRARTTFQNAVLTAGLIEEHGIRTVLLVTDRYHMPRSFYLLRMALAGTGVEILPCPVQTEPFSRRPWQWPTIAKKRVYNEMIEFWGSLVEMGRYEWTGRLPEGNPRENAVVSWLREVLLFRV